MYCYNDVNDVVLVCSLLTLNIFRTLCVCIANFEHVIAGWVGNLYMELLLNKHEQKRVTQLEEPEGIRGIFMLNGWFFRRKLSRSKFPSFPVNSLEYCQDSNALFSLS